MTNSELLAFGASDRLLLDSQRQGRYILRLHIQQMPCPNCGAAQNLFDAAGVGLDDPRVQYDAAQGDKLSLCDLGFGKTVLDGPADPVSGRIPQHDEIELPFRCVRCQRRLKHSVPLIMMTPSGWLWELVPESEENIRKRLEAEDGK